MKLSPIKNYYPYYNKDMLEQKQWEKFYKKFTKLEITSEHIAIVDIIKDITNPSYDIIDIGCGRGEYSFLFSKIYPKVYALDIASSLIEDINKEIKEKKIDNIHTINMDYEKYNLKHDISFLSFSPCIQSIEDIKKVISLTNKYVFILTVDKGSKDRHRYELIKKYPPKHMGGFIKDASIIKGYLEELNILYKEERFHNKSIEYMDKEEAINYFITYFTSLGYKKEEIEEGIKEYITNNVIDNKLKETHMMNKSLIYFKV